MDGRRPGRRTEPTGSWAGIQSVAAALVLIPVSFLPGMYGQVSSPLFQLLVVLLGAGQLVCAIAFYRRRCDRSARRLLRASLVYLPALLLLMMFIPWM